MSPHPRAPLEGLRLGGGRGSRTGGRARVWALAVWVMGPPGCDDGGTKSDVAPDDDLDGDGFSVDAGDCDDADALVFPGASEACDGVDNNCDGAVDEGVTETWFPDGDGDGFGADDQPTEACSRPDGFVPSSTDCDDADSSVFPGALEVCDGIDTDCDDIPDPTSCRPLGTADLRIDGLDDGMRLGAALAGVGDWTGDGVADLAVGAPDHDRAAGWVGIFAGPFEAGALTSADAVATLAGVQDGDGLGYAMVGLPDLDGDGRSELAVGAWGDDGGGNAAGAVSIYAGGPSGSLDPADVLARYEGVRPGETLGIAVRSVGDIDADGVVDLVLGAPGDDTFGVGSGAAVLVSTATDGSTTRSDDAFARIYGAAEGTFMGQAVDGPGDLGGDGLPDLLVAAPGDDTGGTDAGAFYILSGPVTGDVSTADAIAAWYGEAAGDQAGGSIGAPGDVDGDGYADLVVGAPDQDLGGSGAGLIYILYGPTSGVSTLAEADARVVGRQPGDHAGNAVDATADIDGDGRRDVLVGAYIDDSAAINAGAAYLVLGPWSGTTYLTEAEGGFIGEAEADLAGWAVELAGDLTGSDGGGRLPDIVIGAPGQDARAEDGGTVYVVASENLVF